MPSTQRLERSSGEAAQIAARAERHRKYARLFAALAVENDPFQRSVILAEIRMMLRNADHGGKE
jgi:hypothetical protein